MNDAARNTAPPVRESREADESVIDRHRDALKSLFPMPLPGELAPRRSQSRIGVPIVIGLLSAVVVAWDPAYRNEYHATTIGQRDSVELTDGSRVVLDADSRIEVSMHLRSRRVALLAGRALFEVSPTHWRPFEVDAGDARIRVVGTVFDVRRGDGDVAVAVVKGVVAVTPSAGDRTLVLRSGQRVDSHGSSVGETMPVDAESVTSWTRGRLIFDHTPLSDVAAELQRYRRQPVHVADPALGRLRVSGVFDSARVDEALDLLPQILPVRVLRQPDGSARIVSR